MPPVDTPGNQRRLTYIQVSHILVTTFIITTEPYLVRLFALLSAMSYQFGRVLPKLTTAWMRLVWGSKTQALSPSAPVTIFTRTSLLILIGIA